MKMINTSSSIEISDVRLFALLAVCVTVLSMVAKTTATEPLINVIRCQASDLNCAAEDMRDEIKTHFRGTRCYRRLLGTNAQIKTRSAAVLRRIDRDPCYRGMKRDIAKLNELTCKLSEVYKTAIFKSNEGLGRPVVGGTDHVVDKLVGMIAIADRLNAASLVLSSAAEPAPGLSDSQVIHVSEFDPNIDVAPGVPPVRIEQRLRPNYEQPPTLELEAPTLEAPKPVFRSVLEK
jgi:hypothetical protein